MGTATYAPRLEPTSCWRRASLPATRVSASVAADLFSRPSLQSHLLELQSHVREQREQSFPRIDIAKTLARRQRPRTAADHDVFRQRRAILRAHVVLHPDRIVDRRLKQKLF